MFGPVDFGVSTTHSVHRVCCCCCRRPLQADRRLRHVNLTRVAIDLKDSALLPLLQLHMSPPADLTDSSRCCAGRDKSSTAAAAANAGSSALGGNSGANGSSRVKRKPAAEVTLINQGGLVSLPKRPQSAAAAAGGEQAGEQQQGAVPWVVCGKHLCGAAADFALRACLTALTQQQQQFNFQGLAIASCCHHRSVTGSQKVCSCMPQQ